MASLDLSEMMFLSSISKEEIDLHNDPSCSQSSPPIISTLMNASAITPAVERVHLSVHGEFGNSLGETVSDRCTACSQTIFDRSLLLVDSQPFHEHCLRCSICDIELTFQSSCFFRDGMLFCRRDYSSKYLIPCGKCGTPINKSEIVMRARETIYHVPCFCCSLCSLPLHTGDMFWMHNGDLFCHSHCEGLLAQPPPQTEERQRKVKEDSAPENDGNGSDFEIEDGQSGGGRHKRMRTSFKHHQLRTMKTYFGLNHNPDAKDLKQLAVKTGLTKRVLQVWFQNARAKYRRSMQQRDHSSMSPGFGGSLDSGQIASVSTTHSPTTPFHSSSSDNGSGKLSEYFDEPCPGVANTTNVEASTITTTQL